MILYSLLEELPGFVILLMTASGKDYDGTDTVVEPLNGGTNSISVFRDPQNFRKKYGRRK